MGITVKIGGVDRTEYVDARSLSIIDELTSRVNSASFVFICNDIALAPIAGEAVLIEEGANKLFSGRILTKEEDFLPPNLLKYQVECIDNTRDLDKKLVMESYLDQKAGDIIKDIITKYTSGFTTANVADGPTVVRIAFDYVQVSEAITKIAETCGYEWYIDYDKDLHFFLKTAYPASFQLDDNQAYYRDLIINTDISQLRNRVYVKSSKYETLDFTELFIGDGVTVTWTCKYQANALPAPSATLNDVAKTVGWDGVDNPNDYDFMLNATTKVLSLGTYQSTPADGDEIVITYGADVAIIIKWDDQDSIDAIKAIEGGDGIFEYCITDNNIDTKEWAIDVAKADLLQNADPIIEGTFTTNKSDIRSGQIITLNSTKRNINQDFLVQKVELVRVDVIEYGIAEIPYKPAAEAIIGYKPTAEAEVSYKPTDSGGGVIIYYIYQVTIATKLKGLEDLLLSLLYQSSESLKRDTTAPDTPTGLALSTGMGEITQASLAWLKATWNTNSEDDFSYYELKYKKTAYSDFGLVTTTNTSFLWTGLEQNIEYEVYIRSVDIYGNRSSWSSQVTQVTATDSETPTQITGVMATALFNGVKINWDRATEDNIACYIVERQESPDNVDWTGVWTERVRLEATMWLDLFLTYTKWYRYRVTAYTQTSTNGITSSPSNAVQPKQAATVDIENLAITASLLATGAVTEGKLAAGAVTEGKVGAAAISEIKLATNAVTENKIKANAVVADKILAGAIGTDKLAALAVVADKIAANAIVSDKIATLQITTDKIAASAITTAKINAGAITTNCIAALAITADLIAANSIYTNALQAGAITADKIGASEVLISKLGSDALARMFQSNDYKANVEAWAKSGAITYIDGGKIYAGSITLTGLGTTIIEGGYIKTSLLNVDYSIIVGTKPPANADYFGGVAGAMAYESNVELAKLGTTVISGGYLRTDLIKVRKIYVGGGTNEDIFFEDSGIRMYDVGDQSLQFYKSGLQVLNIGLGSNYVALGTAGNEILLVFPYKTFWFYGTGTLCLPRLANAPTAHDGDCALKTTEPVSSMHIYTSLLSNWYHSSNTSAGW